MSDAPAVVVLAAGQGTRMKSDLPKVLHEAAGRPLLEHVLRAVAPLEPARTVVVVGHGADVVRERFSGPDSEYDVTFVLQSEQLGTGHALMQARGALAGHVGPLLVLNGDGPLLRSVTLAGLLEHHRERGANMTLLTCEVRDPTGLGRILRGADGRLERIVEEKDASERERAIREINPGIYLLDGRAFDFAERLGNDNASGEYYITDLPGLYLAAGLRVETASVHDEEEILGVNDRRHLARIDAILRDRVRERWLHAGVTMVGPDQVFIDDTATLEPDVVLYPGTWLLGSTTVGAGAVVGPYAVLEDCRVAPGVRVDSFTRRKGARLD